MIYRIILSLSVIGVLGKFVAAKEKFTSQFGTKTTYFNRPPIENSFPWKHENVPSDLKVSKIDATLRHGTRFPSLQRANELEEAASKFVDAIKDTNIDSWVSKFSNDTENLLSSLGWDEHVYLGQKYFSMAPELWQRSMENNTVTVQSSSKVRALASARAFLTAIRFMVETGTVDAKHPEIRFDPENVTKESNLLDGDKKIYYRPFTVQVADRLVRFFDNCSKYLESVINNNASLQEYKNYLHSDVMHHVSDEVHPKNENPEEIFFIYLLCAFEIANFNESTWCQFFRDHHFLYLDYAADLIHFYKTGYGFDINHEQSCVLLQAMVDHLDDRSSTIALRFGHAETLIPLVCILGFFNETGKLFSNNSREKIDRKFRTAKIGPFSGNLALVLYTSRHEPSQQFLCFVLNEYIVKPFGLDCYFCEYHPKSMVYQELRKRIHDCEHKCTLKPPKKSHETHDEL